MLTMIEKYKEAIEELERFYVMPQEHKKMMEIIPLVKNGKFLIWGPYGFGKSMYAYLVGKIMFSLEMKNDKVPVVKLMDELTVFDVFYYLDIGKLMKGEEKIYPREIVVSSFKFINELQRGNSRIYNAMLGLYQEGELVIRDNVYRTDDYVAIMDANPFDSGSTEIPRALMDRITGSFTIPTPSARDVAKIIEKSLEVGNADIREKAMSILDKDDMKMIWDEVLKIKVPKGVRLLLYLSHNYFNRCERYDKAVIPPEYGRDSCSGCRWRSEPCSSLLEPLGIRWIEDTIRISMACAYLAERNEVSFDDIFFAMRYTLPHRIRLREDAIATAGSEEVWVKKIIENIKREMYYTWIPSLSGGKIHYNKGSRVLQEFVGDAYESV